MKLAIMQPYFLPYIGYFQLINRVDRFVIYDDVAFIRRGWIHRNRILVAGQAYLVTVPVRKVPIGTAINQVHLADNYPRWVEYLFKTLSHAYKKAPQYSVVEPLLRGCLEAPVDLISRLNIRLLRRLCDYIGISTELILSSEECASSGLKGSDRIVGICMQEGASVYVNASGGRDLYDHDKFERYGMSLKFIQSRVEQYRQFNHTFTPNLSILDVMMFLSPDEISDLIEQCDLVE